MNRVTLNIALYLDKLSLSLLAWGYAAGALLLLGKVCGLPPDRLSVLCAISLVIPFAVALMLAAPRFYSEDYLRAWLDLHNRSGGALLRRGALPAECLRSLRVRPAASLWPLIRRVLLPMGFLIGALLVPPPGEDGAQASGKGVQSRIKALERKAAEFVEKEALPKPLERAFLDQLNRVEQAAQSSPEAAAESLSVLEQKLEKSVLMRISAGLQSEEKTRTAAQSLQKNGQDGSEAAEKIGQMLEALENQQSAEGGELPEEVQKALQELMQKMGAAGMPEMKGLSPSMLNNMKPEDLKKLMEALKKCNGKNAGACQSLQSMMSGKEAAEALKKMMQGSPKLSGQDLKMSELGEEESAEDGEGNGGVNRGPGHAKLRFGDEADRDGVKFRTEVMPPAQQILPGITLAQERHTPGEQQPPEEFRAVTRTGAQVRGSVNAGESGAVLSPARSQAAQSYFEQLSKPQK